MTNYLPVIDLMQLANEKIQYPKIHLHEGFVLQRAGNRATYPGSINITDGKPYGQNQWYGRITTDGRLSMPNHQQRKSESLETQLALFQLDPAAYATLYGKATANCMFCHKELTAPQSIAVGYGPTCAANYGLPWGELDKETADKMSRLQLEMPTPCGKEKSTNLLNPPHNPAQLAEIASRDNCDCGRLPPNMSCSDNDKCQRQPTVIAERLAIDHLKEAAIIMLSEQRQAELAEQCQLCDSEDEYMLMATALWEAL